MRLFVAIELPEGVRRHLGRVQEALRGEAAVSWIRFENLHLTLKFMGEVEDAQVPGVCAALEAVRAGRAEPPLRAGGLICFPERGPVRIIGAAVAGEPAAVEKLHQLQREVEGACAAIGFAAERRRFSPHVTLARARRPLSPAARGRMEHLTANVWPGPQFLAGGFVLMQSVLRSAGAQYQPLARFGEED